MRKSSVTIRWKPTNEFRSFDFVNSVWILQMCCIRGAHGSCNSARMETAASASSLLLRYTSRKLQVCLWQVPFCKPAYPPFTSLVSYAFCKCVPRPPLSSLQTLSLQILGPQDTLTFVNYATPVVEILRSFEQCSGDGFCAHIVSQEISSQLLNSVP
jgi:hypothetical protein